MYIQTYYIQGDKATIKPNRLAKRVSYGKRSTHYPYIVLDCDNDNALDVAERVMKDYYIEKIFVIYGTDKKEKHPLSGSICIPYLTPADSKRNIIKLARVLSAEYGCDENAIGLNHKNPIWYRSKTQTLENVFGNNSYRDKLFNKIIEREV